MHTESYPANSGCLLFFFSQMKLGYGHTKKYTSKKEKDTITEAFQVLI